MFKGTAAVAVYAVWFHVIAISNLHQSQEGRIVEWVSTRSHSTWTAPGAVSLNDSSDYTCGHLAWQ